MAKYTFSCANDGYRLEIDDSTMLYKLSGPIHQVGKITNTNMTISANCKLFCCAYAEGITIIFVDHAGFYEVFDFDRLGQTVHRFMPSIGVFGSQKADAKQSFITLTCCDLNEGQQLYVAMEEEGAVAIYAYQHNGSLFGNAKQTFLQSIFGIGNPLNLVDLACCNHTLQIIAYDETAKEFVSGVLHYDDTTSCTPDLFLNIFDPNLDPRAEFVTSVCCDGKFFILFEVNGQNILYESANTNSLGSTSSNGWAEDEVDGTVTPINGIPVGNPGDIFVAMTCCEVKDHEDFILVFKTPDCGGKFIRCHSNGSIPTPNGIKCGHSSDTFVSIVCCPETLEVFLTLKTKEGVIKLFGFDIYGGLIGGTFLEGFAVKKHECHAVNDFTLDEIYIFQTDSKQNYVYVTEENGTALGCPQRLGNPGDTIENILCCANGEQHVVLITLKDATSGQLYINVLNAFTGELSAYKYAVGAPGDEIVHLSCCNFIPEPPFVQETGANVDILVVLKTLNGLFKLEVFNNATGTVVYGPNTPALGVAGDEFFSLVCCGASNLRKLVLVLKHLENYSIYSFVETPVQSVDSSESFNVQLIQEYVTEAFSKVSDDSVLLVFNSAMLSNLKNNTSVVNTYGLEMLSELVGFNSFVNPLFFDVTKTLNVLVILDKQGHVTQCPVVLPCGTIEALEVCDIDNNGVKEVIVVLKDHQGATRICALSSSGAMISGLSGTILGDGEDEFVDFSCCDINGDQKSELVFVVRHKGTCQYHLYAYNAYGKKLFCRNIGEPGQRFVSLSCCPVDGRLGGNDTMVVFRGAFDCYFLSAYNAEGRRYYLYDLQFKQSDDRVMFRYNVGYDDHTFKLYSILKNGRVLECPVPCKKDAPKPLA